MYELADKITFTDVKKIAFGRDLTQDKVYEVVKFGVWNNEGDYFFILDDAGVHLVITKEEYQYTKKVVD